MPTPLDGNVPAIGDGFDVIGQVVAVFQMPPVAAVFGEFSAEYVITVFGDNAVGGGDFDNSIQGVIDIGRDTVQAMAVFDQPVFAVIAVTGGVAVGIDQGFDIAVVIKHPGTD